MTASIQKTPPIKNAQCEMTYWASRTQMTIAPAAANARRFQRLASERKESAICDAAPVGLRPRVTPIVPGRILVTFFSVGTTVARTELPPSINPPNNAPPTVPTPPTTASKTTGKLCVKSYCCGLTLSPANAPAQAAMPAEIANAASLVRVRLIPKVAAATGESLRAMRRRPSRLRRIATTPRPKSENATDAKIKRPRGELISTNGMSSTGTAMLPPIKVCF